MLNSTIKPLSSKSQKQIASYPSGSRCGVAVSGPDGGGRTPISCPPQLVNFGCDTLELSYKIQYDEDLIDGFFSRLSSEKVSLQDGTENERLLQFGAKRNYEFNLQRSGRKFHAYVLRTGDAIICLSPRDHESTYPNMLLKIGSMSSQGDLPCIMRSFYNFVRDVLGTVVEEKVSRIDLAADINCHISVSGVQDYNKMITRSNKLIHNFSHKHFSGLTIGKGAVSCRIYNKIQEMTDKQDAVKASFFNELWDSSGKDHTEVTRVEFQLRREFLKEIGVTDFNSVLEKSANLWKYLTEKWLRFSEHEVDRKNQNQNTATVSEFWLVVQNSFENAPPVTRRKVKKLCDIEALSKQVRGCLTSILAAVGHSKEDYFGMMGTAKDFLETVMNEYILSPDFGHKFESRRVSVTQTM